MELITSFLDQLSTYKFRTLKKTPLRVFLLVTTEGDLFDNQIKSFLKISFDSKCDWSLLQILLTT